MRADLADDLDVQRLFTESIAAFGGVDVVVHTTAEQRGTLYQHAAQHVRRAGAIVSTSAAERIPPRVAAQLRERGITVGGSRRKQCLRSSTRGGTRASAEASGAVLEWRRCLQSGGWGSSAEQASAVASTSMLAQARGGRSAVLVIRGEPGIGKTALLRYAARQASGLRVAQVEGVQAEMELPVSGIQRLCAPLLDAARGAPQNRSRTRSRVALGISSGDAPDRFLVAVAVLNLLAATAAERPLLCLVDDAQWLDATSLGRSDSSRGAWLADAVAMIFALREPATTRALDGLPQLSLEGLDEPDARALLSRAVPGRLDDRVRDRIIGETRGNPLALWSCRRG